MINRVILVCKILFNFNNEDLYENLHEINKMWNQTPHNIITFVGKHFLEEQVHKIIPHINKLDWLLHLNQPIEEIDFLNTVENISNNNFEDFKYQFLGVTGKKFNGKDTISNYFCQKYGFIRIAYADPLKEICKILFQLNDQQLYGNEKENIDIKWKVTPRFIYQYIGTELFRKEMNKIIPDIDNKFWIKCLTETIKNKLKFNPNAKFIISDIRFQNEIHDLKKQFDCKIIRVKRSNINFIDNHESELFIDNLVDIDYEINNDGSLEDLHYNLKEIK